MEFRSQRQRGGGRGGGNGRDDGHGYGSKHRDDRGVSSRGKRRVPDEDRSTRSGRSETHRSSVSDSSSKDHQGDRKQTGSKPFTDDSRLSMLMKRVMRNDDDRDRRLSFIKQLNEYLMSTDNYSSVQKVFENIFTAMIDIIHERIPRELKQEVAVCLGIVGYIVSHESERYFELLFPKIISEHSEDPRLLMINALFETLKQDASGNVLSNVMPMVMAKCQQVLESADTAKSLMAIVDVISHIVQSHPQCFESHFRDTVDILVGWHIDAKQKDGLVEFTSDALVGFRQFWNVDLRFSLMLLGQFLEDMEAYTEDLLAGVSGQVQDADMLEPEECTVKIASLLRVFTTVIRSLLDGPTVNNHFLVELFVRLLKCTDVVLHNVFSEAAVIAANNCLRLMVEKLGNDSLTVKQSLCKFVSDEAVLGRRSSRLLHLSFLNLANKIIKVFGTNITTEFLSELMGPKSILPALCFSQDIQVLEAVLAVYKSIMALKSVPLLELAYRCMITLLEAAYNVLLRESLSDVRCNLVASDSGPLMTSLPVDSYDVMQAETVAIFCITVVAEIGNAKNNLIGMWALSPSIFSLFSERLLLLNGSIMEHYPMVHYAAVQAFHSHCSRHDNFIFVSNLVTQRDASLLASVSGANAGNLAVILSITAELLFSVRTPDDTRCLVLKWVKELTELMQQTQLLYTSPAFIRLIAATVATGYNPDRRITKLACQCLLVYVKQVIDHSQAILNSCLDLVRVRLSDSDNEVRNTYIELIQHLPLPVASRLSCSLVEQQPGELCTTPKDSWGESYQHVVRTHMLRLPSGTFHSHNFTDVMSHILNDTVSVQLKSKQLPPMSWLERQFFSCQRWSVKDQSSNGRDDGIQLEPIIGRNERLLWFWATWEAAQFCVLSRLRTPLGKPQDTFSNIESAIKQCSNVLRSRDVNSGETVLLKAAASSTSKPATDSYEACLRTCHLLLFMEFLERHVYNSIEGCAVAMPSPPKAVRTFFWTNRATCREWFSRIRLPLMFIAQHNNEPATVVRHGLLLLNDIKDSAAFSTSEFEQTLVLVVDALCRLRAPEAIQGLMSWARQVSGHKMQWIKPAIELAAAKYELAVSGFKSVIQSYISSDSNSRTDSRDVSPSSVSSSPHHTSSTASLRSAQKGHDVTGHDAVVLGYLTKQVCESYVKIGAWDDAVKWQDTVHQYHSEHAGSPLQKAFYTGYDANYLRALLHFDNLDFVKSKSQLETILSSASITKEMDVKSSSSATSAFSLCKWDASSSSLTTTLWGDVKTAVSDAERLMVHAVTLKMTSSASSDVSKTVGDWLAKSQSLCETALRVGTMSSTCSISNSALLQLCRTTLCANQLDESGSSSIWAFPIESRLSFNTLEHDISIPLKVLQQYELQKMVRQTWDDSVTQLDLADRITELRLSTANLARRQSNFNLCEQLLIKELPDIRSVDDDEPNQASDRGILAALSKLSLSEESDSGAARVHRIRVERESAKLLFGRGQSRDAVETMVSAVVRATRRSAVISDTKSSKSKSLLVSELSSRSLLSVVKWLQSDVKYASQLVSKLQQKSAEAEGLASPSLTTAVNGIKILTDMEIKRALGGEGIAVELSGNSNYVNMKDAPSDGEMLSGRLLHLSTMQCPSLAKSWFALASWCYKWGRKAVDGAAHGTVELTAGEKAQVLDLLPTGVNLAETDAVLTVLGHIHAAADLDGSPASEEDIGDQDQVRYDDGADTVRRQLITCSTLLQSESNSCVEQLVEVWRAVVHRVYHYYQLSAKSYFTYLRLNAESNANPDMDGNVTATLRLLRLLVKHAWELRDVLEEGLAHSPTVPWKGIIPQLFSRLNHPEPYVRQSVTDLLCRLAHDAPHLIIYPAVVGYSSGKDLVKEDTSRDGLLNDYLSQSDPVDGLDPDTTTNVPGESPSSQDDDAIVEDRGANIIQNCFATILDTLTANNLQMTSEVQLFVTELRRITLLWDELWLGALSQMYQDVMRRLKQLEHEVTKVTSNVSLTADETKALILKKHRTILKPTIYALEQLQEVTQRPAETPHETGFQESFSKLIDSTLDALNNPVTPENPNSTWIIFKQLHHSFQQRAQKRTGQVLNMNEISSRLVALKHTAIAMPGPGSSGTTQVTTIDSIHNAIQILPTKTKPKKLIFIGSDGLRYPYLFKGLEDLHLDERIMQLLSIINNMFVKNSSDCRRMYRARHYSVTPLGARSGLIRWVEGAVPMFSLYKRWHQRDAAIKQQQMQQQQQMQTSSGNVATRNQPQASAANQQTAVVVPRPSEVFYNKLNPLLREKGVTNTENRKEWPLSVLRKVLDELMAETPKDLLSKELWCSSSSASEWWLVTQTYARSTAVISMIGYVIGLGDRHLDNVLIDLTTGEVVHIDYNVCFEKGKSLRVPEKVPFRMTQNLETALGITGVEGTFRSSCEHALRTMRSGRETLLTLLEAFVYDPLVDWTVGADWGGAGYTGAFYRNEETTGTVTRQRRSRREMDREITSDMFSIRVAEAKHSWLENRDQLMELTRNLHEAVRSLMKAMVDKGHVEASIVTIQRQLEYLNEASKVGTAVHPIHTLIKRYQEYMAAKLEKDEAMKLVDDKLSEVEQSNKAHSHAMSFIRGPKLKQFSSDCARPVSLTALAGFPPVVDFLQGAGQGQLVSQCEQMCAELQTVVQQHNALTLLCLEVLHKYATVLSHQPCSLEKKNRSFKWQQWLQELICEFTSRRVQRIEAEMHAMYSVRSTPSAVSQHVLKMEHCLEAAASDSSTHLRKLVELFGIQRTNAPAQLMASRELVIYYVGEQGLSGVKAISNTVTMEMCALTRRYLDIEAAIAVGGLHLPEPKSPGGTWLLDQLISLFNVIVTLFDLLNCFYSSDVCDANEIQKLQGVVRAASSLCLSLQDLHFNFCSVIVPEALTAFQAEEPSVVAIVTELDHLVASLETPLDDVVKQLELICASTLSVGGVFTSLSTSHSELLKSLKIIRTRFEKLYDCQDDSPGSQLTAGQMLLMGFAGMFSRLDSDFTAFVEALALSNSNCDLSKLDVINEANTLRMSPVFSEAILDVLSIIFFTKQVKVMQEFFHTCSNMAAGLRGSADGQWYDDEQLSASVKEYIGDYLNQHLSGLVSNALGHITYHYLTSADSSGIVTSVFNEAIEQPSIVIPLASLCTAVVEANVANEVFSPNQLENTQQMLAAFLELLHVNDLTRQLDRAVELQRSVCQRVKLQLMCFQWLHEDILTAAGHQASSLPRATVMTELKKTIQAIVVHEREAFSTIQSRLEQLKKTVVQRLKWAAGANPTLAQTLQSYEDALSIELEAIKNCVSVANEVVSVGKSILHFEAMMTRTQDAVAGDGAFLILMNKCENCCLMLENVNSAVTETEANLMQSQGVTVGDIELTAEWIEDAVKQLNNKIASARQELASHLTSIEHLRDNVHGEVGKIRTVLATHHKLMSDMRTILKAMAKLEEHDHGLLVEVPGGIRSYLSRYKLFSEQYTAMLKMANANDADLQTYENVDELTAKFDGQIAGIYDDLVSLAPPLFHHAAVIDEDTKCSSSGLTNTLPSSKSEQQLASSTISGQTKQQTSGGTAIVKDKVSRDPKTGKAMQERNTYAVGVWRRVKQKLDGRDIDTSKRVTVSEQVELVIKEAVNLDNLAVMYEGWTSWV